MRSDEAAGALRLSALVRAAMRPGGLALVLGLFVLALACVVTGNVVYAALDTLCGRPCISGWQLSHYMLSYQDLGFVKRGLVGTVLNLDNGADVNDPAIVAAAVGAVAALAALFALLLAHPRCRPVRWLVVVSPALFLQAGSDLGRFDFINDVITLLILVSGRRAILAAPVMILIHEGAAAIQMPILFALHLILHGRAWEQVAAAALTLAALAAVALFGRPDPALDIATLYPHVAAEQYAHIAYSLGESFAYVRRVMVEHLNLSLLRNFAVLLAYAGLALAITLRLLPKGDRRWLGAALLAFAPLALSLVAIDWARWIALAVTNLWIVLIVALIAAPRPTEPGPGTERMIRIGCLFALLGPMGASYPLPGPFALIKLLHGG